MFELPDAEYYQHVITPFLSTRYSHIERLALPMIDRTLSKSVALPRYLWGLVWDRWEPNPQEGTSVFLEGYDDRGDDNHRKRAYYSAVTPALYRLHYRGKVEAFFDRLLDPANAGLPLMQLYMATYFDLYWDLHLGVQGADIPPYVIELGHRFMACMADIDVFSAKFREDYLMVRRLRPRLQAWTKGHVQRIREGRSHRDEDPTSTFAHYWLANGLDEPGRPSYVMFECFHNFIAFSQWGHTLYRIMQRLRLRGGDPEVRRWYEQVMTRGAADGSPCGGSPFSPLDRFVMELFRTISPNGGSISVQATRGRLDDDRVMVTHQHHAIGHDSLHWSEAERFDPERYLDKPTSDQIDQAHAQSLGMARCPFQREAKPVSPDRTEIANSGFGTVYSVHAGRAAPVCDYAGYAPFGFGYRRCPGELLTVAVFEEFLRRAWGRAEFVTLSLTHPERVAVGPGAIVDDDIGFEVVEPAS